MFTLLEHVFRAAEWPSALESDALTVLAEANSTCRLCEWSFVHMDSNVVETHLFTWVFFFT